MLPMGMPVKLSNNLVSAAREEAARTDRSLTAQIEHWAKLGQQAERSLSFDAAAQLKAGAGLSAGDARRALAAALAPILGSAELASISRMVAAAGKPVYGSDPDHPGLILQTWPDGTTVSGTFDAKQFKPEGLGFNATFQFVRLFAYL